MEKIYAQYGCGLWAPKEWLNFDASPTLRIQKTPILNRLLKGSLNVVFPDNVRYGDIIKGLPLADNSCEGIYCSHTLEHLSLNDCRIALKNTYRVLKPGGVFRCVVPDLEYCARQYITCLDKGDKNAVYQFMGTETLLGVENRPRGLKGLVNLFFGNAHHLWMWDFLSLSDELAKAGFNEIRRCAYNDSRHEMFRFVEDQGRFCNAVAIECYK